MNFFDNIKVLYQKGQIINENEIDLGMCIALNKWLSFDRNNLVILRKLIPYLYFIEPNHYFYCLYWAIPKNKVPFLKKYDKNERKDCKLLNKIKYVMGWSKNEFDRNSSILNRIVSQYETELKKDMGIEK